MKLRSSIALEAQKVYNSWEQDDDGYDYDFGSGGICDQISSAIQFVIYNTLENVECIDGGQDGDDHAYTIVHNNKEAYEVDIPHSLYESGGGYSWKKIEGVVFSQEDVIIHPVKLSDIYPDNETEEIDPETELEEELFEPWKHTKKQLLSMLLFHGTGDEIQGNLDAVSQGEILWTAESPAVAQNYIFESGIIAYFSVNRNPKDYVDLNSRYAIVLLEQMGYDIKEFDIQYDEFNRVKSWKFPKNKPEPTNELLEKYLQNNLKYVKGRGNTYNLKVEYKDGNPVVLPADYKSPGKLYMMIGRNKLNIYDQSNFEFDNQDPNYSQFSFFEMLRKKGYDGFRINDVAQSKTWGNVGHTSVGIFPEGLKKVKKIIIDAVNFDWSDSLRDSETPEFVRWHRKKVEEALNQGKNVPDEVLKEYPELTGK